MEIPAITTFNQATTPVAGTRAPTVAPHPAGEGFAQRLSNQLQPEAEVERQAAREKSATGANTQPGAQAAQPSLGRIRFEMDDGTRVAKFFDTKDVLIYQVPPEGTLYLVRLQEETARDQVETSA